MPRKPPKITKGTLRRCAAKPEISIVLVDDEMKYVRDLE